MIIKKIFKKPIIIIVFFIFLIEMISRCAYDQLLYDDVLYENWNITILRDGDCTLIYDKDRSSFNGDGFRFHMYNYENIDYVESKFDWGIDNTHAIFSNSLKDAAEHILDELNISDKYKPDYMNCLYFYDYQEDNSEIIILIDTDNHNLYICESFL